MEGIGEVQVDERANDWTQGEKNGKGREKREGGEERGEKSRNRKMKG